MAVKQLNNVCIYSFTKPAVCRALETNGLSNRVWLASWEQHKDIFLFDTSIQSPAPDCNWGQAIIDYTPNPLPGTFNGFHLITTVSGSVAYTHPDLGRSPSPYGFTQTLTFSFTGKTLYESMGLQQLLSGRFIAIFEAKDPTQNFPAPTTPERVLYIAGLARGLEFTQTASTFGSDTETGIITVEGVSIERVPWWNVVPDTATFTGNNPYAQFLAGLLTSCPTP